MEKIVVGVDGSSHAGRALRWAVAEAKVRGATLLVVHAYESAVLLGTHPFTGAPLSDSVHEERRSTAEATLAEMLHGIDDEVEVVSEVVADTPPARALLQRAKGADLLVVGSRGRGGFAGLLLGSVSQQCMQHAPCPVVVVPDESRQG